MKRQVMVPETICDVCKEQSAHEQCLGCGADTCYLCQKTSGVGYNHAVSFCGSGDGYYCHACDARLRESGKDKLHSAYMEIAAIREERQAFFKKSHEAADVAEEALKRLLH